VSEFLKPDLINFGRTNLSYLTLERSSEPEATIWAKRISASCIQNIAMMMMMKKPTNVCLIYLA